MHAPAEILTAAAVAVAVVVVAAAAEEDLVVDIDVVALKVAADIAEVSEKEAAVEAIAEKFADIPRQELVPYLALDSESVAAVFVEVERRRLTYVVVAQLLMMSSMREYYSGC